MPMTVRAILAALLLGLSTCAFGQFYAGLGTAQIYIETAGVQNHAMALVPSAGWRFNEYFSAEAFALASDDFRDLPAGADGSVRGAGLAANAALPVIPGSISAFARLGFYDLQLRAGSQSRSLGTHFSYGAGLQLQVERVLLRFYGEALEEGSQLDRGRAYTLSMSYLF